MIYSCPIFTTFVGGIPARMKSGWNCIEIPVKDEEGIANIIFNKITDTQLMNKITDNSRKTVRGLLSNKFSYHHELVNKKIKEII